MLLHNLSNGNIFRLICVLLGHDLVLAGERCIIRKDVVKMLRKLKQQAEQLAVERQDNSSNTDRVTQHP